MLTGENGILNQAQNASTETEKASVIEQAKTDIIDRQIENQNGSITKADLKEILGKYFDLDSNTEIPDDLTGFELKTKEEYGGQTIEISDIYNGTFAEEKEYINTETSYVGYYADIDGNGSVDGVIYADLARGNTGDGQWTEGDGTYQIPKIESGLKNYYVSQTGYAGLFGTKDVLKAEGNGADRFYVMALSDVDSSTYYWYYNAAGNMDDYSTTTSQDFGTGKTNTSTMISKWNNGGYGTQDDNDMWKVIQIKVGNINDPTWFVPSRAEWSAFAEELGITKDNYPNYGLKDLYWSSSQSTAYHAYLARFDLGYIYDINVYGNYYVRLSATF